MEQEFILKAGSKSINVVGNPNAVTNPFLKGANIKRVQFVSLNGSWSQYDLNYPNLPTHPKEGCIYILLNPKTKNFYIGESENFTIAGVLKRHRTYIAQTQAIKAQGLSLRGYEYYDRIVNDLVEPVEKLFYSIIEYTDEITRDARKAVEENYIKKAFDLYDSRIYNPPTAKTKLNVRKRSEASKELNRLSAITNNLQKQSKTPIDTSSYPCIVKGKWFDTMEEANKAEGFSYRSVIKNRLLSPQFPQHIWLKDLKGKQIPLTDELIEKRKIFYLTKAVYYKATIDSQYKNPISLYYQKISKL